MALRASTSSEWGHERSLMEVVEIEKRVRDARVCVYVLAARGAWAHSTNGYMRGYATKV